MAENFYNAFHSMKVVYMMMSAMNILNMPTITIHLILTSSWMVMMTLIQ